MPDPITEYIDHAERAVFTGEASDPIPGRLRARIEQAGRDKERADWSSWLDNWTGAVTPTPPTVDAIADALRTGARPFGAEKGTGR